MKIGINSLVKIMEGENIKNHIKVNGNLLQINKRFSQLKQDQKIWITEELYKLYHAKMQERRTTRKLPRKQREEVISSLYRKIEDKGIWIPYDEIEKYTNSKISKIVTTFQKQFPELSAEFEAEHAKNKDKK